MKNNHIYIDESGNFKNNNIFIVCFVVFKDLFNLNKTISIIENFKNKFFTNNDIELHFNKESLTIKNKFFKLFTKDLFTVRYIKVLSKNDNLSEIDYIIKGLIENKDLVNHSIIYIDGFKSKNYNRKIITKIKKDLQSYKIKIKFIKYSDSKNSPLIQLADMFAGCIRRRFERNSIEDIKLYNIIKKFIQ